jgi:hypothetical protein
MYLANGFPSSTMLCHQIRQIGTGRLRNSCNEDAVERKPGQWVTR